MNRMAMWITVLATSCGVAACLSLAPAQNASGSFTFGLFGDLAYVPQQEPEMQRVLDEVNATPDLAFVAHVGDLAGTNACPNEFWDRRLAQFQASRHPLIYTPGDNEWVDCHEKAAGAYDPLERLARLRTVFFPDEQTLGQRRFRVERQSADPKFRNYRENARWQIQGITFFTLHNTGSNNNLGRYPAGDAEHRERTAANI
jgi:hypothetical protein